MSINKDGYYRFMFMLKMENNYIKNIHRLVAENFIENPNNY